MKMDPEGKAELESILLGMHPPGPLRKLSFMNQENERPL